MPSKYKHLSKVERDWIFLLLSEKKSQKEIAVLLDRDKSTISRELKRGGNHSRRKQTVYLSCLAHERALRRAENSRKTAYINKTPGLRQYVEDRLSMGWSPDQIAGALKRNAGLAYINRESIYRHIYSREGTQKRLGRYLRQPRVWRIPKHGRRPRKAIIPNRVEISLRPPEINARREFGHWEGDTMVFMGHKQWLATQVERKTRYIVAVPAPDKTAAARAQTITGIFRTLPGSAARTFTFDNGTEFAAHEKISAGTGAKVYFTEPYAAWQKGSVENANGLIRWYLPRMTDINKLAPWKLDGVIKLINNRPRKCLNYRTPAEAFAEEISKLPQKVALLN